MIETLHKYLTKIAIGGCIANLGRGDILNCDRSFYCKTWQVDIWNCSRRYDCQTG